MDEDGVEYFKDDHLVRTLEILETGFFIDAEGIEYYLDAKGTEYYQNAADGEYYAQGGAMLRIRDLPKEHQQYWEAKQHMKQ